MVTGRTHRMTELFGRLAPEASLEEARAELTAVHTAIVGEHPEAYSAKADLRLSVTPLRDQITAPARTILLLLLAAAGVVFVIACSNVANLILARSVRREGELAVRAALGASHGALRRTLLAESLVLCGAGAMLGVLLARPFVAVVARFAARFSVRALEVTVDASLLWVGAGLAMAAAVLLAYVPRLPSTHAPTGLGLASGSVRITPGTNRRLRAFAMTQIAFSFVLLAGAGTLLAALIALQTADTGYNMRQVLAFDLPTSSIGIRNAQEMDFYQEVTRRIDELAGVEGVALGSFVPWRDAGQFRPASSSPPKATRLATAKRIHTRDSRIVAPALLRRARGPGDRRPRIYERRPRRQRARRDREREHRAEAVPERQGGESEPCGGPTRSSGSVSRAALSASSRTWTTRTCVRGQRSRSITRCSRCGLRGACSCRRRAIRTRSCRRSRGSSGEMSADQPVERAATLEDIRAEVLAPERLNAFVLSGFAGVALLIAIVGVAGVLAFSVSARTREFGVRLAVGSSPRHLLVRVLSEGAVIVLIGVVAGVAGGYAFGRVAASYFENITLPGALPVAGAAIMLVGAAILASLIPAARASRVDVLQALRSE